MQPNTAEKISQAWGKASLPNDMSFHIRPVLDEFAANLIRLLPTGPDDDAWALVEPVGLGDPPSEYGWAKAAAIMAGDSLYVVGGAVNATRQTVAVVTRRFSDLAVHRVLFVTDADGEHTAEWTFKIDEETLIVAESCGFRGGPGPRPDDREGAFARKLARHQGWALIDNS